MKMREEFFIYDNLSLHAAKRFKNYQRWGNKWTITDKQSIEEALSSFPDEVKYRNFISTSPFPFGKWLRGAVVPKLTSLTNEAVLQGKHIWVPLNVYEIARSRETNSWIFNCLEQPGFSVIPPDPNAWISSSSYFTNKEMQEYRRRISNKSQLADERTEILRELCDSADILWKIANKDEQ